jgi:anti-anti-sigma factor
LPVPRPQPRPEPDADPSVAASPSSRLALGDTAQVRPSSTDRPTRAEQALATGLLEIRAERRAGDHVLALSGELDLATAPLVEAELEAAAATDADQIVLDLCGLDFIDSTGLRLILNADARARANGQGLRLLPGSPRVQRIFEITATTDRLPFADR